MTKKNRKKRAGAQPGGGRPKVHAHLVAADSDLTTATTLAKSALLYADTVTLCSPAASMLTSIAKVVNLTEPADQVAAFLAIIDQIPELRADLPADFDPQVLVGVAHLSKDPRALRELGRQHGSVDEIEALIDSFGDFTGIWSQFQPAMNSVVSSLGGEELMAAVNRGVISVSDLFEDDPGTGVLADAANAALHRPDPASTDDLIQRFLERSVGVLSDPKAFPVFDAQAAGLMRSLHDEVEPFDTTALAHGTELSAAARMFGYLPAFDRMGIDEILDLRREVEKPLIRFRAAMSRMTKEFGSGPLDQGLEAEVADAWRREVEPALLEIRETFADHGLLRESATIALGDPRRTIAEVGGAAAVVYGGVGPIASTVVAGILAGVAGIALPAVDSALRGVMGRQMGRRDAQRSSFYLLHQIESA